MTVQSVSRRLCCAPALAALLLTGFNAATASDLTVGEVDALIDKPGGEWLEGEHYDPLKGVFTINHVDMRIPGNGPDLVVVRDHRDILTPRFVAPGTTKNFCDQGSGKDYVANPLDNVPGDRYPVFDVYGKKIHFFPLGGSVNLFPNDAVLGSTDNWYAACDSGRIKVKSPNGLTYEFGHGIGPTSYFYGRATKVTDTHGNWIAYNWQQVTYNDSLDRIHLASITASDGRAVGFDYGTFNGVLWRYREIANTNPRRVLVDYTPTTSKFTNVDGTYWQYTTAQNGMLSRYRSPTGLTIDYTNTTAPGSDYLGNLLSSDPAYSNGVYRYHNSRTVTASLNHSGTWHFARSANDTNNTVTRTITSPSSRTEITTYRSHFPEGYRNHSGYTAAAARAAAVKRGKTKRVVRWSTASAAGNREVTDYTWSEVGAHGTAFRQGVDIARGGYRESIPSGVTQVRTTRIESGTSLAFNRYLDEHDSYGNPGRIRETSPRSGTRTLSIEYDNTGIGSPIWFIGRWSSKTLDGFGGTTRSFHSSHGRVHEVSQGGRTTTTTYDPYGNPYQIVDPDGKSTFLENYVRGVPTRETNRNGAVKTRSVNDDGTLQYESVWGNTSARWRYEYDNRKRVNKVTSPQSGRAITNTVWVIDGANKAVSRTDTRGSNTTTTVYNSLLQPTRETVAFPAAGGSTSITNTWSYDGEGRATQHTLSQQSGTSGSLSAVSEQYQYDGFGRHTFVDRTSQTGGTDRTQYLYHAESNQLAVTVIDPLGKSTKTLTDAYGHPGSGWTTKIVRPLSQTLIGRDKAGRMDSLTQGDFTRRYTYFPEGDTYEGLLRTEVHPETGTTTYTYHLDGQLKTRRVGNQTTTYSYTNENQLSAENFDGTNTDRTFSYHPTGTLQRATVTGGASTTYTYDLEDQLTRETLTVDGRNYVLQYGRDSLGNLSSLTYPSGVNYAFSPDGLGRPSRIAGGGKTLASGLRYWPNGQLNTGSLGAMSVSQTLTRNHLPDVLHTRRSSGSGPFARHDYGYDAARNVSQIDITGDATQNLRMAYDNQHRLTRVTGGPYGTYEYAYDAVDNIDWVRVNGTTSNYNYNTDNEITSISGGPLARSSFSHDPRGNITWNGKLNASYNSANQITQTTTTGASATTTSYRYDGHGRRVRTSNGTHHVYNVYGADGVLRHRSDPTNDVHSDYHYAGGKLVARWDRSASAPADPGTGGGDTGGGNSGGGDSGSGSTGGNDGGGGTSGFTQGADGTLVMEAESATAIAG
ncbi:MAG: hypothetical protein AAGA11_21960, partial [Pseudomonadota bacterium]